MAPTLRPMRLDTAAPSELPDFVATYLSPRLDTRLAALGTRLEVASWDRLHRDPGTWESLAAAVAVDSRRAAESAARGFLLDRTGLDRVSVTFGNRAAVAAEVGSLAPKNGARVRLGFSGIVPRLDWSLAARGGEFRLQVAARGDVAVRYESGKSRGLAVGASLDPLRDAYGVSLLRRF